MSKENTNSLRDSLNKNSFKIKPILLELKNYNFFHSVQKRNGDDTNNRFLGRKAIIDRIKSFIYETNKNTGTYLVSGFRGMGKTSVVNKAISSLSPKSKFTSFFVLIISLLPLIIFISPILDVYKYFYDEFVPSFLLLGILFLFLIVIFYLGHRSPRLRHNKNKIIIFWKKIERGVEALFNPKFYRHKYMFHRLLRLSLIYTLTVLFFVIYYSLFDAKNPNIETKDFEFFWFVIHIVILWYLLIDLHIEVVTFTKKNDNYKDWIKVISIIAFSVLFFMILICHYYDNSITSSILFKITIISIYFIAKTSLKLSNKQANSKNYNVSLNRIITLFDFQHYISVKINLGKDNLTEKDVLKYITNELYKKYRKWYYDIKSFKRLVNLIVLLLIIYLSSTIIYRTFLGNQFTNFSIDKYKIAYFFPSQGLLEIEDKLDNFKIKSLFNNDDITIDQYNNKIKFFLDSNKVKNKIGYTALISKKVIVAERQKIIPNKDTVFIYDIEQQSIFNKTLVSIGMVSNQIDYLSFKFWYKIRHTLIGENAYLPIFNSVLNKKSKISVAKLYPEIPILSVFLMMLLFLFSYRFVPNRLLIIKTHYYALRELKKLKNEIDASIIVEQGGSASSMKNSFFNYLKRSSYSPLESKDITQRLIHILDDVSTIYSVFTKVRLIFVFDELDKINSNDNTVITNLEDEFEGDNNSNEVRYQARRKERIGRILSSMKHFLNSAHAKFIFIAGREMYDAALAGISDRESSLDSIFNDNKIYVNSFYTEGEDNNPADITSITEQYLCQFLIPDYYLSTKQRNNPSIKMYNIYLNDKKEMLQIDDEERVKIISTLKNFVVYLAYRSNGAPRKLSSLIEQYILPVPKSEISGDEYKRNIIVGSNNENMFLQLGFYDQYKFNLISYLTSPIFLGLGNYIHEYSDKLLVSISYMLDHIFKHHKFGLSYRSLSLTPEIVDINKEPQFREFLDKLISYLTKSHLRPIVSGIYDFKFHGKIESEIKFLSKINEQEAAAFNFTLDESIELKRHFNKRLELLKQKEADIIVHNTNGYIEDYINNISLLHVMIGDLHFNDEEFHEAIVHYMDAIQVLRQKPVKDMTLYEFVLFVRNQLKLGLSFEKNKMFDSALMTFSELTDLVIRKRNIPIYKLGLARFIIKKSDINSAFWRKYFGISDKPTEEQRKIIDKKKLAKIDNILNFIENDSKQELIVVGRLNENIIKSFQNNGNIDNWKILYPVIDMKTFYSVKLSDVMKNLDTLDTNYKPLKNYFLQSTGENVRLLYQPIIAKLHLIEKASPDKLKDIDVVRAIEEFNFLKFPLKTTEKRLIVAEFYNKIGDLLYFKNGTLNKCLKKKLYDNIDDYDKIISDDLKDKSQVLLRTPIDATLFYIKSLVILLRPNHDVSNDCEERENLPVINFIDYYKIKNLAEVEGSESLESFFLNQIKENLKKIENKIDIMVSTFIPTNKKTSFKDRYAVDYLFSIANGIIDLVECLTSYINDEQNSKEAILYKKCYLNPNFIFSVLGVPIERILNLYHFAGEIYKEIGEFRLARSQKLKILYTLNQCSFETLKRIKTCKLEFVVGIYNEKFLLELQSFLNAMIKLSYAANNETSFMEQNKLKSILSCKNISEICQNSIIGMEVMESITIYWHFVHKVIQINKNSDIIFNEGISDLETKLNSFLKNNINPNSIILGKNNRILLLSLMAENNKCLYIKNQISNDMNTNASLILNSIGACNEIIKTHDIFSLNYVTTSNIGFARAHYQMGYWCGEYEKLKKSSVLVFGEDKLEQVLKDEILNSENLDYIDSHYHFRLSLDYNHKVKDFHTRGASLYSFIQSASYLDDFYNDNLIHFSISIERNMLQKGYVDDKIEELSKIAVPIKFDSFCK
ncbi:ATP-binding protein [Wocania ichthyoenteri]|uniref:ATP-binding protein n=1 Tax=Wocania ichthyoenteri TaxID=1230531 RepID=UPI00053E89FC|nr:ATP-binding protein [Wocania ichthyoenteri]